MLEVILIHSRNQSHSDKNHIRQQRLLAIDAVSVVISTIIIHPSLALPVDHLKDAGVLLGWPWKHGSMRYLSDRTMSLQLLSLTLYEVSHGVHVDRSRGSRVTVASATFNRNQHNSVFCNKWLNHCTPVFVGKLFQEMEWTVLLFFTQKL